jgi:ABC-type phosphate/phosphonate transport system ATPase subunit
LTITTFKQNVIDHGFKHVEPVDLCSKHGIIKEINAKQKTTVVLVTHEPDFAAYAPRQVQLADGRVVQDNGAKTFERES